MSEYIEVPVIVEGATEEKSVRTIIAPYLGYRNIGMTTTQVLKPGQKGIGLFTFFQQGAQENCVYSTFPRFMLEGIRSNLPDDVGKQEAVGGPDCSHRRACGVLVGMVI